LKIGNKKLNMGSCISRLPASLQRTIRRRYYLKILRTYRESDWEWSSVVLPMIDSGGVVIDVGANVGYLSKLFADRVGETGKVISIEPIPDTFDSIHHNMGILYPGRVTVLQNCLSDQPGHVSMVVPRHEGGGENFYESHIVSENNMGESGRTYAVEAITLDLLSEQYKIKPCFIKIDVEGHEWSVVKGACSLLSGHKPPMLIEVSGNPDEPASPAASLFSDLDSQGYLPFTRDGGTCRTRRVGDSSVDYLFLTRADASKWLHT